MLPLLDQLETLYVELKVELHLLRNVDVVILLVPDADLYQVFSLADQVPILVELEGLHLFVLGPLLVELGDLDIEGVRLHDIDVEDLKVVLDPGVSDRHGRPPEQLLGPDEAVRDNLEQGVVLAPEGVVRGGQRNV